MNDRPKLPEKVSGNRPWWRGLFAESKEIAKASWRQTIRLLGFARSLWRKRSISRAASRAQVTLGQRMSAMATGDQTLRNKIADLENRIRQAEAKKERTKTFRVERDDLFTKLAVSAVTRLTPPKGAEAEYSEARLATTSLQQQADTIASQRASLPPRDRTGWKRVTIGYSSVLLILSIAWFSGRTPRHAEDAGLLTSGQVEEAVRRETDEVNAVAERSGEQRRARDNTQPLAHAEREARVEEKWPKIAGEPYGPSEPSGNFSTVSGVSVVPLVSKPEFMVDLSGQWKPDISDLVFSQDDKYLYCGRTWIDLSSKTKTRLPLMPINIGSPLGDLLFVDDKTRNLIEGLMKGDSFRDWNHTYISRQKDVIVNGGLRSQVKVWRLATGSLFTLDVEYVDEVALSPDGKSLVISKFNELAAWDTQARKKVAALKEGTQGTTVEVGGALFSRDGRRFIAKYTLRPPDYANWQHNVSVWDTQTWKETKLVTLSPQKDCGRIRALSPDERLLVTGQSPFKVWNMATGKLQWEATTRYYGQVIFGPRGDTLVTGVLRHYLKDKLTHEVTVWDALKGTVKAVIRTDHITYVAMSNDGKRVATASLDGKVRLWETANIKHVSIEKEPEEAAIPTHILRLLSEDALAKVKEGMIRSDVYKVCGGRGRQTIKDIDIGKYESITRITETHTTRSGETVIFIFEGEGSITSDRLVHIVRSRDRQ